MGPKQLGVNVIVGPNVLNTFKQTNLGSLSYALVSLNMKLLDHAGNSRERISLVPLPKLKQVSCEIS
jgi:hypothetical protein